VNTWEESKFRRIIRVDAICRKVTLPPAPNKIVTGENGSGSNRTCEQDVPNWEKIGIHVTSAVRYTERGTDHTVTVTDDLYNWK